MLQNTTLPKCSIWCRGAASPSHNTKSHLRSELSVFSLAFRPFGPQAAALGRWFLLLGDRNPWLARNCFTDTHSVSIACICCVCWFYDFMILRYSTPVDHCRKTINAATNAAYTRDRHTATVCEQHCILYIPKQYHSNNQHWTANISQINAASEHKMSHRPEGAMLTISLQSDGDNRRSVGNSLPSALERGLVDTCKQALAATLWRPLLPYGYSYRASCARPGFLTSGHSDAEGVRVPGCQKLQMTA